MSLEIKQQIKSQYHASLEMLRQAIEECPDDSWDNPGDKNRFWQVAYHTLFYVHLYLAPTEGAFVPWQKHREHYPHMGSLPWARNQKPEIGEPYTKEEVLEYLALVRGEVEAQVDACDLAAESGFYWLPMKKLEHLLYNIRHLMLHTGELSERLWVRDGIEVGWVAKRSP